MSSTGNIFRHGALFSFRTSRLFTRLLAVPVVLLTAVFLLSGAVSAEASCTPKIVHVDDGEQPDFVEAGSSATFSWKVKNTSTSCDAIDYHLGFDGSVPDSSSADYGGENQPTFTLLKVRDRLCNSQDGFRSQRF